MREQVYALKKSKKLRGSRSKQNFFQFAKSMSENSHKNNVANYKSATYLYLTGDLPHDFRVSTFILRPEEGNSKKYEQ